MHLLTIIVAFVAGAAVGAWLHRRSSRHRETSSAVASEAGRLLARHDTPPEVRKVAASALAQHEKEE